MDNLEKYIKDNTEAFNDAGLPEGHLDRFLLKLNASAQQLRHNSPGRPFSRLGREAQGGQGSFDSVRKRTRRILWTALAVAASLTVFVFLNHRPATETHDWFANVGNDQLEICQTYYEKAGELYEIILAQNPDGSMDESVGSIADGGVPLVDQLPDDMDPDARATILKEYYGELLNGLERMKNIK